MSIAATGQVAAVERLLALPGEVRAGAGWRAVRTGADSNDLNGVVSEPGFVPSPELATQLVGWLADVPATWLTTRSDPRLTEVLVAAGLRPERSGRWAGREVAPASAVEGVERVVDLGEWEAVARACGWADRPAYDDARRAHWVARREGVAVGMASGWRGSGCELVDVAVLPAYRRAGVGTALVTTVLAWAHGQGAAEIVAAPSPEGWALMATLGFVNVPDEPDVTFYNAG